MGTQRTLATHRLPKLHAPRAPQWPWRLATGPSLALATALASSPRSTCRQHRVLYQLMQPSKTLKRLVFYPSHSPHRHGFYYPQARTHARLFISQVHIYAHLFIAQACTYACLCIAQVRISAHLFASQVCPYACLFTLQMHTGTRLYNPQGRTDVRLFNSQACLKFSLPGTHAHIFGVQAHTYARLSPNRPCMWGPHPLNTPVRPPVHTLPKN